jgi:uncharacterized protein YjiS (DUF1127 family)
MAIIKYIRWTNQGGACIFDPSSSLDDTSGRKPTNGRTRVFPSQEDFAMRDYVLNQAEGQFYGSLFGNLRRYIHNWTRRRMLRSVENLDDYLLRDIGLTRSVVESVLDLPLVYDPVVELHRRLSSPQRLQR